MLTDKQAIFNKLKITLGKYATALKVTKDNDAAYELLFNEPVKLAGREFDNLFFASAVVQKNFVGFYFFPIYTHGPQFSDLPQELKKVLKGKSCFNFKKLDDNLISLVDDLLAKGLHIYQNLNTDNTQIN